MINSEYKTAGSADVVSQTVYIDDQTYVSKDGRVWAKVTQTRKTKSRKYNIPDVPAFQIFDHKRRFIFFTRYYYKLKNLWACFVFLQSGKLLKNQYVYYGAKTQLYVDL